MTTATLAASAAVVAVLLSAAAQAPTQQRPPRGAYPLTDWQGRCGAKGRFQDREYCTSSVVDRVVADGPRAIPLLISQMTDERVVPKTVLDHWPRIRAGELAVLILEDLFLDDTWQQRTMPELFPDRRCDPATPASECWVRFREKHSLAEIQARWLGFWRTYEARIHWDEHARCFRLRTERQQRQQ